MRVAAFVAPVPELGPRLLVEARMSSLRVNVLRSSLLATAIEAAALAGREMVASDPPRFPAAIVTTTPLAASC
jgi:hypothetical protein